MTKVKFCAYVAHAGTDVALAGWNVSLKAPTASHIRLRSEHKDARFALSDRRSEQKDLRSFLLGWRSEQKV